MMDTPRNPEIVKLQAEIEAFRKERGLSRTGFGVWAANDPNLLSDIDGGRDPRWRTIAAIRERMAEAS